MVSIDVGRLVTAQASVRDRLTAAAILAATREVERFEGWYDSAAITSLAGRIVSRVEASQRQLAGVTDAYLARVTSQLTGRRVDPVGAVDVTKLRRGIPHAMAYGRLADQYRRHIADGASPNEALKRVVTRGQAVVETDLDLAHRAQAHRFVETRKITGYRRVIRPELSRHGSCGLCLAASDRLYHRGNLLPIHDRCKCAVVPIVGKQDPGAELNRVDLEQLYAAAGGTTAGAALKRVQYVVHEHGELGPVLRQEGHHFRGPDDIAA